ncbi:MAG: hypothetical protein LWW85_10410 [Marinilabiliales bacterium]|nr:hypothetical protein [Marinilabiliales bacterium]
MYQLLTGQRLFNCVICNTLPQLHHCRYPLSDGWINTMACCSQLKREIHRERMRAAQGHERHDTYCSQSTMMETRQNFKDQFLGMARWVGSPADQLYNQFGPPDETFTTENRILVWYKNSKTTVCINLSHTIESIATPRTSAIGGVYTAESDLFTLDGISQGSSRSTVAELWGEPDRKSADSWGYHHKAGRIPSDPPFELQLCFDPGGDKVTHFEARLRPIDPADDPQRHEKLIHAMPFEEIYARVANFLGFSEKELIAILGPPDRVFPGELPNEKYVVYPMLEAGFALNGSGIVQGMVCPFLPDKQKIAAGYYEVRGIKVGDSVERICQVWGQPSKVHSEGLIYEANLGKSSRGYGYLVQLTIEKNALKWFNCLLTTPIPEKAKSGCFIATACYGDENAREVVVLRAFRDAVLLKTTVGKGFVRLYYRCSPPLARVIARSKMLQTIVRRGALAPMVKILGDRRPDPGDR